MSGCSGELGKEEIYMGGSAEHVPTLIEASMATLDNVLSGLAFIGKALFRIGDGGLSLRIV